MTAQDRWGDQGVWLMCPQYIFKEAQHLYHRKGRGFAGAEKNLLSICYEPGTGCCIRCSIKSTEQQFDEDVIVPVLLRSS